MNVYSKCLSSWFFKIVVFLISCAFLSIGIWGTMRMRQKFDPVLLLPSDSYVRAFFNHSDASYPTKGYTVEVYMSEIDGTSMARLEMLTEGLQTLVDNHSHLRAINPWWPHLKNYALQHENFSNWQEFGKSANFYQVLSDFLFSPQGSSYKYNFKFDGQLSCGIPAPPILAARFSVDYFLMDEPEQYLPAKKAVESIINQAHVANVSFSHFKFYATWETDEIIGFELMRNVGLSLGCVMIVTVVLLVNIPISFYVFCCVVATVVDLVGFLHFWNMTIDIITCINVVLAIGLSVDYVVHIGHTYLMVEGNILEMTNKFFRHKHLIVE
jgi:Niemann-Pick C1 protein